jgi:hypothetical protein
LTDSDAAATFLRGVVNDTTREHAVALYLDPKNRPLGWRIVSIGTDVSARVKPLLVLQPAVLLGANAMTISSGPRTAAPATGPTHDEAGQTMKNIGRASLFDEPRESKRWRRVHPESVFASEARLIGHAEALFHEE